MSRITDGILGKGTAYAGSSPALDLAFGGQQGYMARIGLKGQDGKHYEEWINNHAYIKQNVIPVVLRYPLFFEFMPEKDKWIATYKALIEDHPLTIDGLQSGLTVETDEHAIGGGGEFQEEITDVKRTRSNLSFTFKEKAGKSIQKFLDFVIRYGYKDPDAKKPLVTRYMDVNDAKVGGMYTPDFYTGSVLFIEPDITQQVAVDAWLCSNMFFKGNGERTGKRDIKTAPEAPELTIESSSITMNNEAVMELAQSVLSSLTVTKQVPDVDQTLPTTQIDEAVKAQSAGYDRK